MGKQTAQSKKRVQRPCKFIETKGSVYRGKDFNFHTFISPFPPHFFEVAI